MALVETTTSHDSDWHTLGVMSKRAAIYTRISSDPEGTELGVQRQEVDCRALAEQLGIEDITLYVENDRSASTRSKKPRPQYDAMIKAGRAGEFDVILAYSNSRLTRRPKEAEDLIELYEKYGVKIKTVVSGEDDLATADGRMTARIKASVDAAEAERAAERVSRASRHRAEQGRGNGGTRPYGWTAEDRRKLDPHELQIIKEMADRTLAGESLRSIAASLNFRGVPTVKGAEWSPVAIRGILVNPRLVGQRVYKDEGVVGVGDWEPALTPDVFEKLTSMLLDDRRRIAMSNKVRNLLPGIALCGDCGGPVASKVQVRKERRLRRLYCGVCHLYRSQDPIDAMVTEVIVSLLETLGPAPLRDTDPEVVTRIEALTERIRTATAVFAADDLMSPEDLMETLRPLKERLRVEERKLKRVARSTEVTAAAGPDARKRWESLPLGTKRLIISELLEIRILRGTRRHGFDPSTVEISYR